MQTTVFLLCMLALLWTKLTGGVHAPPFFTYENKNTVAAELKITVNTTEVLYVVEVITINSDGKIKSIRAYLS